MSGVNFGEYLNRSNSVQGQQSGSSDGIGFFSLKNDGDSAIVRILMDDENSVEAYTTHPITVDGKYREVSCLRSNFNDSVDTCPFCAGGERTGITVILKMIKYDVSNNDVSASPCVWMRTAKFVQSNIISLARDYRPLSNTLCKITRVGSGLTTKYSIITCNPSVYKSELYPYTGNEFDGFKALGRMILEKNYNEMWNFLNTGSFGVVANNQQEVVKNDNYGIPNVPSQPIATHQLEDPLPWDNAQNPVQTTQTSASYVQQNTWQATNANPVRGFTNNNQPFANQQNNFAERPVRTY